MSLREEGRCHRRRGATVGAAATALFALSVLVGMAVATSDAAAQNVKVRFGSLAAQAANIYYPFGAKKGLFAKHGVDLQVIEFQKGGPEIIAAAIGQQVDLGTLGTPILIGISRGFPIKVVASPAIKGQEFVLIGLPGLAGVEDLRGKVVGVSSVGGGQAQALRFILTAKGIRANEVKTIAYGNSGNGYASLKSGQLAAAVMNEPNVSKIVLEGSGKVLADAADYYGRYQHSYVFATNAFISQHPETIRKFLVASGETLAYAKAHREEFLDFAVGALKLDRPLLSAIFDKQIPQWDITQAIDTEGLLNAVKIVKEVGDIDAGYQPDIARIVDDRFLPHKAAENAN